MPVKLFPTLSCSQEVLKGISYHYFFMSRVDGQLPFLTCPVTITQEFRVAVTVHYLKG